MNKSVLLIALLLAPLSGCLGVPAGAIGPGANISAVVTVTDADSGETLIFSQGMNFEVGSGRSGLGFEFERALIGKSSDYEGTLVVRDDPSVAWRGPVTAQARFESPLVQQISLGQFSQAFGTPVEGDVFSPANSFFDYQVVAVSGDLVSYMPLPEQGQRDHVPTVGAYLVTTVEGDTLVQTLEPDVGATFRVLPPSPFNPNTPLGLQPGSYRTIGGDGDTIQFEHSRVSNPDLAGRDLAIEVSIRTVQPGSNPLQEPFEGNYGMRSSTSVNGSPNPIPNFGPLSHDAAAAHDDHAEEHHDDGHDDDHDHAH